MSDDDDEKIKIDGLALELISTRASSYFDIRSTLCLIFVHSDTNIHSFFLKIFPHTQIYTYLMNLT